MAQRIIVGVSVPPELRRSMTSIANKPNWSKLACDAWRAFIELDDKEAVAMLTVSNSAVAMLEINEWLWRVNT
jgi:hypothetical protein